MSKTFPLNSSIVYIVEERLVSSPQDVSYAWNFEYISDAEDQLLKQIRAFGPERLYTMFISVD